MPIRRLLLLTLLALASLTATAPASGSEGAARTEGDQRLPDQRPGSGHDRAGADLLHALQAGRRERHEAGADDPAQPRLGWLADHGPGGVPAVARREVRRPVLRPARVRRERWHRPGREPGCRGPRRPRLVDLVASQALGQQGRARRPAAGRDRRQLRRRVPVPRRLRGAPPPGQAGVRRARPRDHLERPQPQPRARGRRPHRVGPRTRGRRRCRPRRCHRRSTRRSSREPRPASGPTGRCPCPAPRTWRSSSRGTARGTTSRRAAGSTSPCCSGRAPPTRCSTSSRAWTTGAPRSRARPAGTASSSRYNGGHVLPAVYPHGRRRDLRPVQQAARRRRLLGARPALHEREPQAPRHRPAGLRQAAPGHARLDVHDGQAGRRRHRGPRRHGRHHRDRRRRSRLPGREGTDPHRRVGVPHRDPHRARPQQPGVLRTGASGPLRSTPHSCRTT